MRAKHQVHAPRAYWGDLDLFGWPCLPYFSCFISICACVMQFWISQSLTHWLHSAQARSLTSICLWYIWQGSSKLLPTLAVLWLVPKLDSKKWDLQVFARSLLMSKQIYSQQWKKKTLLATSSLTDRLSACCSVAETEKNSGVSGRCRPGKLHSFKQLFKLAWSEDSWCSFDYSQSRLLWMVLAIGSGPVDCLLSIDHKQSTCPETIWPWGHGQIRQLQLLPYYASIN